MPHITELGPRVEGTIWIGVAWALAIEAFVAAALGVAVWWVWGCM
jgi:hypothetical protein